MDPPIMPTTKNNTKRSREPESPLAEALLAAGKALDGDSNDAEHDALVDLVEAFMQERPNFAKLQVLARLVQKIDHDSYGSGPASEEGWAEVAKVANEAMGETEIKKFRITEVVTYEIEAPDKDAALELHLDAQDQLNLCTGVQDRTIEELKEGEV